MNAKIMLGCLMAAAMFTSCSDFLDEDPKGKVYAGDGYVSQKTLDAAIVSIYSNVNHTQNYTNMQYPQWQGDDITANPGSNKQACAELDAFSATADNKGVTAAWDLHFKLIKSCNQVIANLSKTGDAISKREREIAEAQAKYWRAYAYYYLVRLFGPLPLILEDDPKNSQVPLTSVEGIYAQITKDLEEADALNIPASFANGGDDNDYAGGPPRYINGTDAYITKQAIKSTLAAVYVNGGLSSEQRC